MRAVALPGDPRIAELRAGAPHAERLQVVEADVTDRAAIAAAIAGARRVYHTAALIHAWAPRARFRAVNVGGLRNVAEAAREAGVERLVHVSTSDVFGIPRRGEVLDESIAVSPLGRALRRTPRSRPSSGCGSCTGAAAFPSRSSTRGGSTVLATTPSSPGWPRPSPAAS